MPTYGMEELPEFGPEFDRAELACQVRGCSNTTAFRSEDEVKHGLTVCDPMPSEGESHYLWFLEAVKAGEVEDFKAKYIIALPERLEDAVRAALRVRTECGMDLNDTAVRRLVETAITEYRR